MQLLLCVFLLAPYATAGPLVDLQKSHETLKEQFIMDSSDIMFDTFKLAYERQYANPEEEELRRQIYKDNFMYMQDHNAKYFLGEVSYLLGINDFSDLTHDEFLATYTGFKNTMSPSNATSHFSSSNVSVPAQVDWKQKGYVTPVKNQGKCGSCWAFSTTGTLEGQLFKYSPTGRLVSLSEQQLIDCSGSFGNNGCAGGLPINAYRYMSSSGGIESEKDYPYEAKNDTCRFNESLVQMGILGYDLIDGGREDTLQQASAIIGPISVGIDASHRSFQLYSQGIYNEPNCSTTKLDHGVLVVGYGTNPDYWLVKNSWGTNWGEAGYIKMSRNKNNQCGIATMATYPLA